MAKSGLEKELEESVAYFEQILDVLPGERVALEFLCVAFLQLADNERFLKYAVTLAEVILREKDAEGAADLIEKLKDNADPRAQAAVLKLQVLLGPKPELQFEMPELRWSAATPSSAAKAEIALLEQLVADGVLSRGQVQTAFDLLEKLATSDGDFLISALSILERENLTGAADAVAAVADAALAPPVPLDAFELALADVLRLPEKLVRVRGVIPFAKLGNEWAVAVLNPLDEVLREEVEAAMGAKCHYFLAPPGKIEKILARLFEGNAHQATAAAPSARPLRRAFTLVEVLVAMVVLALLATGLLVTTWRLSAFAREEADHMVADAYCHDVTWAVYSQHFTNMLADAESKGAALRIKEWEIDPEEQLPRIDSVDLFGRPKTKYPLWRTGDLGLRPKCLVRVEGEKTWPTNTIVVVVSWNDGSEWLYHSNVVTRARSDREVR